MRSLPLSVSRSANVDVLRGSVVDVVANVCCNFFSCRLRFSLFDLTAKRNVEGADANATERAQIFPSHTYIHRDVHTQSYIYIRASCKWAFDVVQLNYRFHVGSLINMRANVLMCVCVHVVMYLSFEFVFRYPSQHTQQAACRRALRTLIHNKN